MLLAALGADVIKVESSRRLDPTRGRENRPYLVSVLFDDVNSGKRSLALDMKTPEGLDIARQLINRSDAVIDNFRPGVMFNWGLTHELLSAANPRLVVASLSAVGGEGPLSDLPGYAGIFSAFSGLGFLTGYENGPPTELRTSVDMRAGAFFALGIVHGLLQAKLTGIGTRIDFSAAESITTLCGEYVAIFQLLGAETERIGNGDEQYYPHGIFGCSDDRWLSVAVRNDNDRQRLTPLLGFSETDTNEDLEFKLANWVGGKSRDEGFAELQRLGIPSSPVQDASDVSIDPQLTAREFFVEMGVRPDGASRVIAAAPFRINGERPAVTIGPPLGQHTNEILEEVLGLTSSEIKKLTDAGILA